MHRSHICIGSIERDLLDGLGLLLLLGHGLGELALLGLFLALALLELLRLGLDDLDVRAAG